MKLDPFKIAESLGSQARNMTERAKQFPENEAIATMCVVLTLNSLSIAILESIQPEQEVKS